MRMLVFAAYYTPEIAASMYLYNDLFEACAKAGHQIDLYTPVPCRGISDDVREAYKKADKRLEKLYAGNFIIHRFSLYKENKSSVARALRYLLMNIVFLWKGLFAKADVIFVTSTPPTQGMMAGILKKWKKIPVVYNLQDIFPDSLLNANMTQEGSKIWKIGRRIEDYSYRKADKIITISDDFKKNIMLKGVPEDKIVVVPNWADIRGVKPIERADNKLIERCGLDPDKFYITYSGNIGLSQNMDHLLDTAKMINDPDICFLIIGDGAARENVEARIRDENIGNVKLLPFQPYEDIAQVFSIGDAGLIISKPGIGGSSVPSKTWGILAAGRPILASFDTDSDLSELVRRENCGITVAPGDIQGLCDAIEKLHTDSEARKEYIGNALRYVRETQDPDRSCAQYIKAIEEAAK